MYDNGGNILERYEYAYTLDELALDLGMPTVTPLDSASYIYDGNVLTSYDGKPVDADAARIYSYDGWVYVSGQGNRLVEMWKHDPDNSSDLIRTFTYDASGMRIRRTEPNGIVYNYIYNGSQLGGMTMGSNALYFTYDVDGTPLTVTYNGTTITRIKST